MRPILYYFWFHFANQQRFRNGLRNVSNFIVACEGHPAPPGINPTSPLGRGEGWPSPLAVAGRGRPWLAMGRPWLARSENTPLCWRTLLSGLNKLEKEPRIACRYKFVYADRAIAPYAVCPTKALFANHIITLSPPSLVHWPRKILKTIWQKQQNNFQIF